MSNSTPTDQDLVLGGAITPPVTATVLGGILGLNQRFTQADVVQKLAALAEAGKYGEAGIELLQQGLQDQDIRVRMEAYVQLKAIAPGTPGLERGLPLRVGDRIYGVYESSVSYGDDWYYIHATIHGDDEYYEEEYPFYHSGTDASDNHFEYVSDVAEDNKVDPYDEGYNPRLIAYFIDAVVAEAKAQIVYQEKFGKLECEIYELDTPYTIENENDVLEGDEWQERRVSEADGVRTWVAENQITVDAHLPYDWEEEDHNYITQVLISLQTQGNIRLLKELWQRQGYAPLGFVHERLIDRPCYLKLQALQ
jgi:hypothetical protein